MAQARASAQRPLGSFNSGRRVRAVLTEEQRAAKMAGQAWKKSVKRAASGRRRSGGSGAEGKGQGPFGKVGRRGPAIGDGEQNGAFVVLQERLGCAPRDLADSGAEAGGEAAEGVGEGQGEFGNVVEGEDPVVAGEGLEIADGGGSGRKGRGAGVDEGAENAGGEGLARGGRTLEDEDGEWPIGAKGGEQPGEAAEPIGAAGKVEAGAEGFERIARAGHGNGEGCGGAGGLEECIGLGGDAPAAGGDFDELTLGVGEVEEDLFGEESGAAGADTAEDGETRVVAVLAGLGLEVIEDGVEGVGGGKSVVLAVELIEEPIAVGAGADGEDVESAAGDSEANEGLTVAGGERDALPGDGEKRFEGLGHRRPT